MVSGLFEEMQSDVRPPHVHVCMVCCRYKKIKSAIAFHYIIFISDVRLEMAPFIVQNCSLSGEFQINKKKKKEKENAVSKSSKRHR